MSAKKDQELILRFPLIRRLEHWINAISFLTLGLTGLVQKYIESPISGLLITLMGGIEFVRIIHRICAIALMSVTILHLGQFLYGWYVQRKELSMLPSKADLVAAWHSVRYSLGLEKHEPKQGFYTFEEKFEYWALVWGTLVMGVTGFFLWNPITAARFLPAAWIPAAKAAHSGEALLAVLAVLIWHFYHVFIKVFNRSMYSGYMEREIMEHEHALVLEEENPWQAPDANDPVIKARTRNFTIVYSIVSVALIVGIGWFVTTETSAVAEPAPIADLADINSYSPLAPTPRPTPIQYDRLADLGDSWATGVGALYAERCGSCHRTVGGQGNLDLTSYEGVLQGGNSGPALVPGSSGISLIVIWPSRGDHPGQLSMPEIGAVRAWIDAGAAP